MYIYVPVKITGPQDTHNYTDSQGKWFCSALGTVTGFGYLWFISDAMFITFMVCSSGSMVLLLHRHHQRAVSSHPAGHHRCPRRPEPPHHPDAHGHLHHLLPAELQFSFFISASFQIFVCGCSRSHVLSSLFPHYFPFLLLLRDPRTPRFCFESLECMDKVLNI